MLTMKEYEALNEAEKLIAILKGNFLADRQENGLVVQLYSLGKIYGEVYYDPIDQKAVRYRAFEDTQQLVPYLTHIDFSVK